MKNKNIKFVAILIAVLTLSFSSLPFDTKAASTSVDSKIQKTERLAQNNLRSKLQARANSTTTSAVSSKESKLSAKTAKAVETAINKANTEITKRIDDLNKTLDKVQSMKNVSESEKASLTSDVQSEVTKLEALKAKIDSDTDLATIKTDLASITSGSRIYALVIPRIKILASVDKINTIATMLGTISVKLQSRIDDVKASSTASTSLSVTALQTALDNITKKVADAKNEALTAQASISNLLPDNGDKAKLDSNNANLKSAKANVKTANQYLSDARKSASIITKGLKSPSSVENKKVIKSTTSTKSSKSKK